MSEVRPGEIIDGRLAIHMPLVAYDSNGNPVEFTSLQGRYDPVGRDSYSHHDRNPYLPYLSYSFDWSGTEHTAYDVYVIAPVDGWILYSDDSHPDIDNGHHNSGLGNTITMQAAQEVNDLPVYLSFSHLQQHSIPEKFTLSYSPAEGNYGVEVKAGEIIGLMGNSGAGEEHHHMQAGHGLKQTNSGAIVADAGVYQTDKEYGGAGRPPVYMDFGDADVASRSDLNAAVSEDDGLPQDPGFPIGDTDSGEPYVATNIPSSISKADFFEVNGLGGLALTSQVGGEPLQPADPLDWAQVEFVERVTDEPDRVIRAGDVSRDNDFDTVTSIGPTTITRSQSRPDIPEPPIDVDFDFVRVSDTDVTMGEKTTFDFDLDIDHAEGGEKVVTTFLLSDDKSISYDDLLVYTDIDRAQAGDDEWEFTDWWFELDAEDLPDAYYLPPGANYLIGLVEVDGVLADVHRTQINVEYPVVYPEVPPILGYFSNQRSIEEGQTGFWTVVMEGDYDDGAYFGRDLSYSYSIVDSAGNVVQSGTNTVGRIDGTLEHVIAYTAVDDNVSEEDEELAFIVHDTPDFDIAWYANPSVVLKDDDNPASMTNFSEVTATSKGGITISTEWSETYGLEEDFTVSSRARSEPDTSANSITVRGSGSRENAFLDLGLDRLGDLSDVTELHLLLNIESVGSRTGTGALEVRAAPSDWDENTPPAQMPPTDPIGIFEVNGTGALELDLTAYLNMIKSGDLQPHLLHIGASGDDRKAVTISTLDAANENLHPQIIVTRQSTDFIEQDYSYTAITGFNGDNRFFAEPGVLSYDGGEGSNQLKYYDGASRDNFVISQNADGSLLLEGSLAGIPTSHTVENVQQFYFEGDNAWHTFDDLFWGIS